MSITIDAQRITPYRQSRSGTVVPIRDIMLLGGHVMVVAHSLDKGLHEKQDLKDMIFHLMWLCIAHCNGERLFCQPSQPGVTMCCGALPREPAR